MKSPRKSNPRQPDPHPPINRQGGVKLKVPQMENVGKLRAATTPIAGNSYWMAFSNMGRRVRPGHRVDVVTEGAMISQGASVKVIAVEGMRTVVRAI